MDEIYIPGLLRADLPSPHQEHALPLLKCDFLLMKMDSGVSGGDSASLPRNPGPSAEWGNTNNTRKPHAPHSSMAAIFRVIKFIHHVY